MTENWPVSSAAVAMLLSFSSRRSSRVSRSLMRLESRRPSAAPFVAASRSMVREATPRASAIAALETLGCSSLMRSMKVCRCSITTLNWSSLRLRTKSLMLSKRRPATRGWANRGCRDPGFSLAGRLGRARRLHASRPSPRRGDGSTIFARAPLRRAARHPLPPWRNLQGRSPCREPVVIASLVLVLQGCLI
jgi:hypothetical protein